MTTYFYQKLRAQSNSNLDLLKQIDNGQHLPGQRWGVFGGLFGVASNELLVVSSGEESPEASVVATSAEVWQPTVRPSQASPCHRQGLYVFRRLHVRAADVAEVVALSEQAWETFEVSNSYAAEPQGLFCPAPDAQGIVRMMLVTWYDGFESWQRSRKPNPAAIENFARRHALTLTTYAVATRLMTSER